MPKIKEQTRTEKKNTKEQLIKETGKWLGEIEKLMPKIKETGKNKDYIRNIKAYISDCKHFAGQERIIE